MAHGDDLADGAALGRVKVDPPQFAAAVTRSRTAKIADMARTLTHFPAFYYWIVRTANDPAAYDQLLDIAWKLALVFGCAFAAEWLIFRVIKRPVALLEARLAADGTRPGADAGHRRPALLRG